ncbi:MAG: hypothetical protein K6G55_04580 [Selenomonadaceae bacterium]|nr:hypothetical protein [Selenomonadaceae bacterium]
MDYLWRNYNPITQYELDLSMKQSTPSDEISLRNGNHVVINPLPRFSGVFKALLKRQDLWASNRKKMKALTNCLLHILVHADRISGLSSASILDDELEINLLSGKYGERIKTIFNNMSRDRKQTVLDFLRKQEQSKGCRLYFREVVKGIFPQAGMYFYKPDAVFLIYLAQEENDVDKECMILLADLFLDVTAKWQIYWHYPFGIIGRRQTMHINGTRLYGAGKDL